MSRKDCTCECGRNERMRLVARRAPGFSLIELLIAMVILAILAAIAVPSYQSYALKSHRTEAKTALLGIASLEERYFTTQSNYSTLPTDLGYSAGKFPINTLNSYYQIDFTVGAPVTAAVPPSNVAPAGTPATFSFTATAIGLQAKDTACQTLTIDSTGKQTATGTDPNPNVDCWN
jgi:type IV pilus assembly protein PilE